MIFAGRILSRLLLFLCLLLSASAHSETIDDRQAIASSQPLATRAGMQVLREGGNAFDAAVTVAAVLAVVEPYGSGLGGGGFWLLHRASDGKQLMVDGRERAPLAARRDMYLNENRNVVPGLSIDGALSAGIPGQVAAMVHINKHYGVLALKRLLQPAIELADKGFVVEEKYRRKSGFRRKVLMASPAAAGIFLHDQDVPAVGHRIVQPDLAKVLQRIANKGGDGFYRGETAALLVKGVTDAGGLWTLKDLQQYRIVERDPLRWQWNNMQITSASLPSSGGVVLAQILNQLALMNWDELGSSAKRHVLIEAMRRAYRDRAEYLGDSDYINVDVARLVGKAHAKKLVTDISSDWATASKDLRRIDVKSQEGRNTTHYSILDRAGNRVSATLSINYPFGSGFVPPGTGILLNDEMDDFSLSPGVPNAYGLVGEQANEIAPGKRMLSSMTPTFIETRDSLVIVGTPGGSRIITMVLQAILSLHQGRDARSIVSQPRLHHQYLPDLVQLEPGALDGRQRGDLERYGHRLKILDRTFGNMQIIIKNKRNGQVSAASDPRGIGSSMVE